ncbi:unnamed protein product [Cyclocybe aegerita]|uniref:Uncharacterized protein n=1 Tax=Cyclocybe aegerita TaxID=1973307 RepID=A0A8S0VYP2_CYCAE|nr:unnamed protein product [Cyclocybe aegerita]
MSAASSRQLAQKLGAIAQTWTKDPFRPNVQLQTFLKSLAGYSRLTPETVEATRALRDNDMMKKYPLPEKLRHPVSSPQYYDRLLEGYEKSSQGISRPLWKVFFGIW